MVPKTWWPQVATLTENAVLPLRFRFSIPGKKLLRPTLTERNSLRTVFRVRRSWQMPDTPEDYGLYTRDEYEEFNLQGENTDEEDQGLFSPEDPSSNGGGNSVGEQRVR